MTNNQTIDGVPRELSLQITLTKQQERDILRFYDTCEDGQEYDVPKDRMISLARLGLVRPTGFSRYEITDAGNAAIEKLHAPLDAHEVLVVPLTGPREWLGSLKPAAQDQGEHLAMNHEQFENPRGDTVPVYAHWPDWSMVTLKVEGMYRTYVETGKSDQPAPLMIASHNIP